MEAFKSFINWLSGPTVLFTLVTIGFFLSLKYTQVWTRKVAYIVGAIMVAFYLFCLTDSDFVAIFGKAGQCADHVCIVSGRFLYLVRPASGCGER